MSDFSLTLVLRLTTSKIINDVAKVQIKSEKITPFGGIFHVRELFSSFHFAHMQLRHHLEGDFGTGNVQYDLYFRETGRGQHVIAPVVAGDSADGGQI